MSTADPLAIDPPIFYVGNPVALVVTQSPDGTANIGPLSSTFTLGRTLVLGWESTSQTLANLERTGEATVNFPGANLWRAVDALSLLTGRNPPAPHKADRFRYTADKWTPSGLTPLASRDVTPPRIAECPLQCEVSVVAIRPATGPDAGRFAMVETAIRGIYAHPDVLPSGPDGRDVRHIDTRRWQPLLYVFRDYVAAGERVGESRRQH